MKRSSKKHRIRSWRPTIRKQQMTFHHTHSEENSYRRSWHEWISFNAEKLKSLGLPPEVYLSLDHWLDFLENGHLHWHITDSTGFEFAQLTEDQMIRLCDFLESTNAFEPQYYPMIGWLRVRSRRENAT